jgi:hypothetical protein
MREPPRPWPPSWPPSARMPATTTSPGRIIALPEGVRSYYTELSRHCLTLRSKYDIGTWRRCDPFPRPSHRRPPGDTDRV